MLECGSGFNQIISWSQPPSEDVRMYLLAVMGWFCRNLGSLGWAGGVLRNILDEELRCDTACPFDSRWALDTRDEEVSLTQFRPPVVCAEVGERAGLSGRMGAPTVRERVSTGGYERSAPAVDFRYIVVCKGGNGQALPQSSVFDPLNILTPIAFLLFITPHHLWFELCS